MITKLKNMIKRAMVVAVLDDTGPYPLTQVTYHDRVATVEVMTPYGHYSVPPINTSIGVVFNIGSDESNRIGMFNTPGLRFNNLKSGEVCTGNPVTGSNIKYAENGDIIVTTTRGLTVTVAQDENVTIQGNCNLTVMGDTVLNTINATINASESATVTSPTIALTNGGPGSDFLVTLTELQNYIDGHVHSNGNGGADTGVPTAPLPNSVGTNTIKGN